MMEDVYGPIQRRRRRMDLFTDAGSGRDPEM